MLTPQQIAAFRRRLETERADLQARINTLTTGLARNEYEYPLDWSDSATRLEGDEEAMAEQDRLQAQLDRVEHALDRIAAGVYGISEVSGKPIPLARLEAMPTATTLVDERPLF